MTNTNTPFEEELEKDLDVFLNNSSWGVTLFAGHRDVLVKEVAKFIKQHNETALLAELERINKANIDNGINFYFEDMKYKSDGWRTMRQYIPERIAALQKNA